MTVEYRIATPADVAECIEIRGRTRESAVSPEQRVAEFGVSEADWRENVAAGRTLGYLCTADGRGVGFCFGLAPSGEILVLAVLPEYKGRGIGKALLRLVMTRLQSLGRPRLYLGCARDPSVRSYGFYRHLGWRPTGEIDAQGDEVVEYLFEVTGATGVK